MKIQSVFFDLDGTLIDSIDLIVACFTHSIKVHLDQDFSREDVIKLIGLPLRKKVAELVPGKVDAFLQTYRDKQAELHDSMVTLYPGVLEGLQRLKSHGLTLGLVTSKGRLGTEEALRLFGEVADCFSVILTADDCTKHKPDPDPLLQAIAITGATAETSAYVGDTQYDIRAAKAARLLPIAVTWGVSSKSELASFNPVFVSTFLELENIILN